MLQVFDSYVIILSWEKQKRCLWNEQVGTAWIILIKEAEMSLKTFVLCQSQLIWFSGVCVNGCFMGFWLMYVLELWEGSMNPDLKAKIFYLRFLVKMFFKS